jgi:PPM family protein phosphatase
MNDSYGIPSLVYKLMGESDGSNQVGKAAQGKQELRASPQDTDSEVAAHPKPRPSGVRVSVQGLTDRGRIRKNNEDNLAACDLSSGEVRTGPFAFDTALKDRGLLFLVADGMGGQACGELASRMCSEQLPSRLLEDLRQRPSVDRNDSRDAIHRAFGAANRSIFEASRADRGCYGMGTTATAALLQGPYLLVAQVGDSRAYLIRNQQLLQLTRDQTFLNYLVDIGAVEAPSESSADPRRSVLTQAMGTAEELEVVLTGVELCQGDRLLLASDGLYSMVPAPQVLSIAAGGSDLDACGRSLIEAANDHGGADNITVILAEVSGQGLPPADPEQPVRVEHLGG